MCACNRCLLLCGIEKQPARTLMHHPIHTTSGPTASLRQLTGTLKQTKESKNERCSCKDRGLILSGKEVVDVKE